MDFVQALLSLIFQHLGFLPLNLLAQLMSVVLFQGSFTFSLNFGAEFMVCQ